MNMRTQDAPMTGVQRYVREMSNQLGSSIASLRPSIPLSGVSGHLWEQFVLPSRIQGQLLWSPGNTGPLSISRQVVTIHDVATLDHPEWFSRQFSRWYRWLLPKLVKRVHRIITVSQFSKNRILAMTGVDESRIVTIPNGVGVNFFPRSSSEKEAIRRRLGITSSRYILSLGSIEPRKNISRLLDAWTHATRELDDDTTLVVAGALGSSRIFQQLSLGEVPRVQFTGFVPDEYLAALYGGALAFVYPSVYEGFGLPVAEAMASGTIPIASNTTSLPEVVGDAGILINPLDIEEIAQAIINVCKNEDLRNDLLARVKLRAAQYSWQTTARSSLEVLEQAL